MNGKGKASSYHCDQAFYALLMKKCVDINNETELHFRGACGKGGDTRITGKAEFVRQTIEKACDESVGR